MVLFDSEDWFFLSSDGTVTQSVTRQTDASGVPWLVRLVDGRMYGTQLSSFQPGELELLDRIWASGLQVLSPYDTGWREFCDLLTDSFLTNGCDSTLTLSRTILGDAFPGTAVAETLEMFSYQGGYCDCEILYNVDGFESLLNATGVER